MKVGDLFIYNLFGQIEVVTYIKAHSRMKHAVIVMFLRDGCNYAVNKARLEVLNERR